MGNGDFQRASSSQPCQICGKPDGCYRIVFGIDDTIHYCWRIHDSEVLSAYGSFVKKYMKSANWAEFGAYQEKSQYEANKQAYLDDLYSKRFGVKVKGSKRYGKERNSTTVISQATEKISEKAEGEVSVADADRRDAVYRSFLDMLVLEDIHVERLKKDWNKDCSGDLFSKIMKLYPIRSLPPYDHVRKGTGYRDCHRNILREEACKCLVMKYGDITDVPGFYFKDGKWGYAGSEGIFFPEYNERGKIICLRIREDYPLTKGKYRDMEGLFKHSYGVDGSHKWVFTEKRPEGLAPTEEFVPKTFDVSKEIPRYCCPKGKAASKYKYFVSLNVKTINGKKVNSYGKGSTAGGTLSIYTKEGDNFSTVYVTEGEKKAIVANTILNVPVISLPGTGTFKMMFKKMDSGQSMADFLVSKGMKTAIICYDADKNTNIRVLQNEQSALKEFMDRGLRVAVGEWDANWGKGFDDTLVLGIQPSIYLCS